MAALFEKRCLWRTFELLKGIAPSRISHALHGSPYN
jgi:hypothetical protein